MFRLLFDFLFLQETLLSEDSVINGVISRWSGQSFWSPAIGKQGGVGILISSNFDGNVLSWVKDSSGRVVSVLIEFSGFRVNLVNIYAPTNLTERKAFFADLHHFFIPADGLILGGDFNCYESDLDKFGGNVSLASYFSEFHSAFNLVDIWHKQHRRQREMSWFNSDLTIGSRMDKYLLSSKLVDLAGACDITPCCFSDHDYVNLVIDFSNSTPRGPGIWKFNNSLLSDEIFCNYLSDCIADLSSCLSSFGSVKLWWDFFKSSLRADVISFAKSKRRESSRERVVLTNRLIDLKRKLVRGDSSVAAEILAVESHLTALVNRSLEGAKTRSRVQWLEDGEKPTRFFFKLERERFERNEVKSILAPNGTEVFTREEIEDAHVDFYTHLFSAEAIDPECKDTLLNGIEKSLSDPDRALCEGFVTLAELTASLKTMNTHKAPGSDGFSVEFYTKFWDQLGPLLLMVINKCFADGELTESMKVSITRLIYKKRGDIKNLKNWRPISLINVDYKICSKAITLRLSKVLDSIIDPDQTCSVPGRSISNNLVLLRDTFEYIAQTDETGILVSLDQEKAFDRVNRAFLMELLERFGFGPGFCRWISTFYFGANMRIILNGWLSKPIMLERGVRQGDSLSPLLYILCVEALACQIRLCKDIRGFLLPGAKGRQFKVRQYADDTTSFLKDYTSLVRLFDIISIYERGSGAKLNKSKTEAMWLGAWRDRSDAPLGLTWVRKMKVLGVFFGTVPVELDNWQPKINKLEKSINLWKSRSLSLVGKSLIVNVLGLSKFFYLAKVLLPPSWVFTRVNSLIWPFLWGSKIETVSRNTCYLPALSGGLSVANLELKCVALRLTSVISTIDLRDDSSFFLFKYYVGRPLASFKAEWSFLRDNLSPTASKLTGFYENCLVYLRKFDGLVKSVSPASTKVFYTHLLRQKSSPPLLPGAWSAILGPGLSLKDQWPKVRDTLSENFKNDLIWAITLRAVKVRDSLKRWGYIDSDRCAFCNAKETIDHCFLNCSRVKRVWVRFAPVLSLLTQTSFRASVATAFFFRWSSNHRKRNAVARFVIKSVLYAIWIFRNASTFRNRSDESSAIIRYAVQDIIGRVKLDHYRLPAPVFSSLWEFPGFCCLDGGSVKVFV